MSIPTVSEGQTEKAVRKVATKAKVKNPDVIRARVWFWKLEAQFGYVVVDENEEIKRSVACVERSYVSGAQSLNDARRLLQSAAIRLSRWPDTSEERLYKCVLFFDELICGGAPHSEVLAAFEDAYIDFAELKDLGIRDRLKLVSRMLKSLPREDKYRRERLCELLFGDASVLRMLSLGGKGITEFLNRSVPIDFSLYQQLHLRTPTCFPSLLHYLWYLDAARKDENNVGGVKDKTITEVCRDCCASYALKMRGVDRCSNPAVLVRKDSDLFSFDFSSYVDSSGRSN